ncbi:MAG: Nif3-like dinuclear metal center hexameric protein [Bacteroidetes bacterium]|nr:Nif3-like dinuclear metal center hexameric protein [Bacteroidota bacterium]
MVLVKDIISAIEQFAPLSYQESYDNSGLQVGNPDAEVTSVLLTLDVTEEVMQEAISIGCNMIVAHHPLLFSSLKSISGRNYVERIVQTAIKNDINIYACHTNLDNVKHGVNAKIAEKLGLVDTTVLAPLGGTLRKLYTYVPLADADKVRDALFAVGAGKIAKYSECSFNVQGKGTFRASADANPSIGQAGGAREEVDEVKLEVIIEKHIEGRVLKALFEAHPYEEVAYEIVALDNKNQDLGAGMVGKLPKPMSEMEFLAFLKTQMKIDCIRYTALKGKNIEKVAICGGSGSFLLKDAIRAGADFFITGDFKYHQFFDAEGKIVIADIGHYESEQFTVELFRELLNKKFPNFAVLVSSTNTNPVKYFS